MKAIAISELARRANVTKETIRYYERRGLIPEPPRTESGYRQYSEESVSRLLFIKRAQKLGFSLREISLLLSLRVDRNTTCADIKNIAQGKISEIEDKIRSLKRIRKALTELIALCSGEGPTTGCPIIDLLDDEGRK
ncbi:MAG: MerR family transcriptional regulator [Deltaproteobacteria bacterium]